MEYYNYNKSAFSLLELIIAVSMITLCIIGLLATYFSSFILNETCRNTTLAMNAAQAQLEELKDLDFVDLASRDGSTFEIDGFDADDAKGCIEVDNTTYSDLMRIRITASWRQRGGKIIGEDTNFNCIEDATEGNGNGQLDSPAELVTFIGE